MAGTVGVDALRADSMDTTANTAGIGGGAGEGVEPDIYYQGVAAISRKVTGAGFYTTTGTTRDMTATGRETWLAKVAVANYAGATLLELRVGTSTTVFHTYNILVAAGGYPSATGGFLLIPIDPNIAGYRDASAGTPALTAVDYYGTYLEGPTSKAENLVLDAIDLVYGLYVTAGTGGSPAVFDDFVSFDEGTIGNRYGIVSTREGILYALGQLVIGATTASGTATAASTIFEDTAQTLVFPDGRFAAGWSGLTLNLGNASTTIDLNAITIIGRGNTTTTDTRPDLTVTGTSGSATLAGCALTNFRNIILTSATTITGSTIQCADLTQGSADIEADTRIITTSATGVATCNDPTFGTTTGFNNMTFEQGAAGHAIEFTSTGTVNLTGIGFDGYGADTTNAAAVYNNSGGLVTLNIGGGGDSPTVRNGTGASTVIVVAPVTTTITVVDIGTGSPIENANVYLTAAAGGPLTPGTAIIDTGTLTDASGQVSDTRSLASNQPVTGRVRRASPAEQIVAGTPPALADVTANWTAVTTSGSFTRAHASSPYLAVVATSISSGGAGYVYQAFDVVAGDTYEYFALIATSSTFISPYIRIGTTINGSEVFNEAVTKTPVTSAPYQEVSGSFVAASTGTMYLAFGFVSAGPGRSVRASGLSVVRTGAASTFYKTSPITGTINSTSGLDLTVQMIRDE